MENSPETQGAPEIWKTCQYRGHTLPDYEVSDLGNVRRSTGPRAGRPRKPSLSKSGYLHLRLPVSRAKATIRVHQLVAHTFLGPVPDGMQIDHMDRNKANNAASNLRYCTLLENMRHRHDRAGAVRSFGFYFGNTKITEEQAVRIRAILDERQGEN